MMTLLEQAKKLNEFFNRFAPAYVENLVPVKAPFPYLTYEIELPSYDKEGNTVVKIYNNSTSLVTLFEIADRLNAEVREEGITIGNEEGFIYFTKGNPFCQLEKDDIGNNFLYINLTTQVA